MCLLFLLQLKVVVMWKGKAPRPDGFLVEFWDIIHMYLLEVVCESNVSKHMLKTLNSILPILIPKKEGANHLYFFHPFALCNVGYTIITELIMLVPKTTDWKSKSLPILQQDSIISFGQRTGTLPLHF